VELAIVASGARLDLDDPEAALVVLDSELVRSVTDEEQRRRVAVATASAWEALGRTDRAQEVLARAGVAPESDDGDDDEVVLIDLDEEEMGE
jgi:hypothetical protein